MSVDDDTLRTELDRLVRPVDDVDGILAQVERRRTRSHHRRTAVRLVAAASVLVLVGVAAVAFATRDDDREVVTAGPAPTEPAPPGPTAPAGPSVTVSTTGLGPLHVTVSELVPSENAWLEHTITIQNTGTETVYVDDHRTGGFLGPPAEPRQLVVGDEGCGYGSGADGEPVVAPACRMDRRDLVLEPGEQVTSRISLWRDLPGLQPVTSETFEFRKPLRHDTHGFIDPERRPVEGQIVLTYRGLADLGLPNPPSTASRTTTTDGPGDDRVAERDDAPPPFFAPPPGFTERYAVTTRLLSSTIVEYGYVVPSTIVAGDIERGVHLTAMWVPDELTEVRDPTAFAERWMVSDGYVLEDIGGYQVSIVRRSAVLPDEDPGLPDRVADAYAIRIGEAVVEIDTTDVDPSVVATLIASIDEAALERALTAAG